jgi:hypothetical protein
LTRSTPERPLTSSFHCPRVSSSGAATVPERATNPHTCRALVTRSGYRITVRSELGEVKCMDARGVYEHLRLRLAVLEWSITNLAKSVPAPYALDYELYGRCATGSDLRMPEEWAKHTCVKLTTQCWHRPRPATSVRAGSADTAEQQSRPESHDSTRSTAVFEQGTVASGRRRYVKRGTCARRQPRVATRLRALLRLRAAHRQLVPHSDVGHLWAAQRVVNAQRHAQSATPTSFILLFICCWMTTVTPCRWRV